jgi:hypothetical protein
MPRSRLAWRTFSQRPPSSAERPLPSSSRPMPRLLMSATASVSPTAPTRWSSRSVPQESRRAARSYSPQTPSSPLQKRCHGSGLFQSSWTWIRRTC